MYNFKNSYNAIPRFEDYISISAADVHDMGDYLKIIVPHSKNDQFYTGSTSVITANGERHCPLVVFRYYFKFFRLEFGNPAYKDKFLNGRFYKDGGLYGMISHKV